MQKEIRLIKKGQNGSKEYRYVRVWNTTVANLTLMALGSSAPEICLSGIIFILRLVLFHKNHDNWLVSGHTPSISFID